MKRFSQWLSLVLLLAVLTGALCPAAAGAQELPQTAGIRGDLDGDGLLSDRDALYALYSTMLGPERYPMNQDGDFNGDIWVNSQDALYLLYASFGMYPLNEDGLYFRAGFAQVDVTPTESVPMDGYASSTERMSTGYTSRLYAMAVAVTDSRGSTALLISVDSCSLDTVLHNQFRAWVQKTYGIPQSNVILSAIHQHSCVDIDSSVPSAQRYRQQMIGWLQQAAAEALADRAPAELYINSVQTKAMSFVRHYWTNAGTMFGDNYGSAASGLASHESDADPEMRLVKFTRSDKKDIVLVNFQTHPHMGGGGQSSTKIHSDWPGIMRDTVARELGVSCLYFSGAGGNLNSTSRISKENISKDYKDHGARAAAYVIGAEGSYEMVSGEGIQGRDTTFTCQTDHSQDHLYEQAKIINDARNVSSASAIALLKDYPQFHSIYHATAVVAKYSLGPTRKVGLTLVSMGDVLFSANPYEMFDTNGMELRQGTVGNPNYTAAEQLENPYKMTVVASNANGSHGYIPSQLNYTNGGYSVDITRFAAGSGERIVGHLLSVAQELHK